MQSGEIVVTTGFNAWLQSDPVQPAGQSHVYDPLSDCTQVPPILHANPDEAQLGLDVVVPVGLFI